MGCATDPGKVFADVEPAVDHRPHRRQAAAAIDDLTASCRRERVPVGSWASAAAQRRPGAQLSEGAMLVSGGGASASVKGDDAAMGGDRSRVSLASPPFCTPIDACPLFCSSRPPDAEKNALCTCAPFSQNVSPLSKTHPRTLHECCEWIPTKKIIGHLLNTRVLLFRDTPLPPLFPLSCLISCQVSSGHRCCIGFQNAEV